MKKDVFGRALMDYQKNGFVENIVTSTHISEEDELPLDYLFRQYKDMPPIEQAALKFCRGKILDVGCGAGSHSLYLQENGFEVKAIDVSAGAVWVAKARGIKRVELLDILEEREKFDSILLLMNGTGIFKTLKKTKWYLKHLKSLLQPDGQIILDSSDIKYMYEDDDGGLWIDTQANYYGELDYYLSYQDEKAQPMKWLYLDFETLKTEAKSIGLRCEKIMDGEHFDYLARLTEA